MNGSAADQLRRLRWVLTALFTGMNTIGLVILAWFLIHDDSQQRVAQTDDQLNLVTSAISRQVSFDGTVNLSLVTSDALNAQCPQFAVLPGGAPSFQAYRSTRTCVPMDTAVLNGLASQAVRGHTVIVGYQQATNGDLVRARAVPLIEPNGQRYFGAVVAVTSMVSAQQQHETVVWLVIGGCLVLVAALGGAGHLLSGRSIRPAMNALQQQEILLAETAHDLRVPVAALRALAEAALANPDQRTDLLPRTVRLAAGMGRIIDHVLVRARLAAGVEQLAIQPIWLDQLVAGVVEDAETESSQVTLTAAPTKVNADPALIQRAVRNLVDNALRYGRRPGEQAIVHITVAGGAVTVADHGPGIDPAAAEEAFDRYRSTGGSSGLGLSIVRWVVQAHGGVLSVYNADEGGAIFELRLPVCS